MPSHSEQQILPYTPEQLFNLVADVARYPEFLPWCRAARILEHGEMSLSEQGEAQSGGDWGEAPQRPKGKQYILAELVIAFSHLSESYTSRVLLSPSEQIDVTMVKGPFEHLVNRWRFTPVNGGTQVDFFLDFKFRSKILEKLMGAFFTKATTKMVGAFKDRAKALYGND